MNILILEDEDPKYEEIAKHVQAVIPDARLQREKNWLDYTRALANAKFDLILLDLLVPRSPKDGTIEDHHEQLVEATRHYLSKSFSTPAIVLTRHSLDEGDFVYNLNLVDINVIPFTDHGEWRDALKFKLLAAQPKKKFDVVIVCALDKEADAFEGLGDTWGPVKSISGLISREMQVGTYKTVIVRAQRMGLVSAAVTAALALDRFEPRLLCMSGICGGVAGESEM